VTLDNAWESLRKRFQREQPTSVQEVRHMMEAIMTKEQMGKWWVFRTDLHTYCVQLLHSG